MNRQKGKVGMLEMTSETRMCQLVKTETSWIWVNVTSGTRRTFITKTPLWQITRRHVLHLRFSRLAQNTGWTRSLPSSLKKREWKQRSGKEGENWLPIKTDTLTEFWRRWMQHNTLTRLIRTQTAPQTPFRKSVLIQALLSSLFLIQKSVTSQLIISSWRQSKMLHAHYRG